jgi:hypothetical protein
MGSPWRRASGAGVPPAKFGCSIDASREEFVILYERPMLSKDYRAQSVLFERRLFNGFFATEDKYEGIINFTEKRSGVWKGK